jgi:uncharacterized protein (DUF433 family)
VVAAESWGLSPEQIAAEYDIAESQVKEAQAFYQVHKEEIDSLTAADQEFESKNV